TISVGSTYQAVVPEGLCKYGDAPAYENEDRLLWDPSKMDDSEVEKYLEDIHLQSLQTSVGVNAVPTGAHVRDDEQVLTLSRCNHLNFRIVSDPMSLWSEEECSNFETGLRFYGKDFYMIHQNKVKTRSVGELVQFYYLWKKTERHDIFANKTRLEKRRYTLHPGVTDYMERFIDDQETPPPPVSSRDRSASPVHSLLYGDPKRGHLKPHPDHGSGVALGNSGVLPAASTHFQAILTEADVNTATTTIPTMDSRVLNPAAEKGFPPLTNGSSETDSEYVPPFKKSKMNGPPDFRAGDGINDLHSSTASSDAQNHVDSLAITSVVKMTDISCSKPSESFVPVTKILDVKSVGITSVEMSHTRSAEVTQ
ncbi:MIER1-like protein, partial [Mya arenaria]